jgi:hypothetical protein
MCFLIEKRDTAPTDVQKRRQEQGSRPTPSTSLSHYRNATAPLHRTIPTTIRIRIRRTRTPPLDRFPNIHRIRAIEPGFRGKPGKTKQPGCSRHSCAYCRGACTCPGTSRKPGWKATVTGQTGERGRRSRGFGCGCGCSSCVRVTASAAFAGIGARGTDEYGR